MKRIIVLSDGETWETLNDKIFLMEVSDYGFRKLRRGEEPLSLSKKQATVVGSIEEILSFRLH